MADAIRNRRRRVRAVLFLSAAVYLTLEAEDKATADAFRLRSCQRRSGDGPCRFFFAGNAPRAVTFTSTRLGDSAAVLPGHGTSGGASGFISRYP